MELADFLAFIKTVLVGGIIVYGIGTLIGLGILALVIYAFVKTSKRL